MIVLTGALEAQRRAPQNEAIRQDDLRADLFFLAGDSLRGRLTDTEENRAAADFIKSRFERMGLKGAGLNGSFFPFATTKAERMASGDPRASLEERYGDHRGFVRAVRQAARDLVQERLLLREDLRLYVDAAQESDILPR